MICLWSSSAGQRGGDLMCGPWSHRRCWKQCSAPARVLWLDMGGVGELQICLRPLCPVLLCPFSGLQLFEFGGWGSVQPLRFSSRPHSGIRYRVQTQEQILHQVMGLGVQAPLQKPGTSKGSHLHKDLTCPEGPLWRALQEPQARSRDTECLVRSSVY